MKGLATIRLPLTNRPLNSEILQAVAKQAFENRAIQPDTRAGHYQVLDRFFWFIRGNRFTRDVFRRYKRYLSERRDLVAHTKNMYLCTARIFLRELAYQGILTCDTTLNTRGFQRGKRHKEEGLNPRELKLLSKRLTILPATPRNNRLKAIVALMMFQGLRPSEISRLKVKDIDLFKKRAFILGKLRDDKEVIDLHPKTVEVLKGQLSTQPLMCRNNSKAPVYIENPYLFPGHKNLAGEKNRPINKDRVGLVLTEYFAGLGIKKKPGALRKTFVVSLIEQFKDLRKVQQFSRHKTLEMLMVYDDRMKQETDLPIYYRAFNQIKF